MTDVRLAFAPTVTMPGGRTVTPEGWMWVLGFALAGVSWAVETASTPEFRDRCRAGLKAMRDREAESEFARLERRIEALKAGLTPNETTQQNQTPEALKQRLQEIGR